MIESSSQLEGQRLRPGERFSFQCHAALACFNQCCRGKRLTLLPYDVLRLRQALQLTSAELLDRHGELELDPETGWPLLRLRLAPDGRCPFVQQSGCGVYAHRPTCCRIFPLSRAVRPAAGTDELEEKFFAERKPTCLGWYESRELTIAQWIQEQGLADYQRANNHLARLLFDPRRGQALPPDERALHATILALYNLDVFRQVVAHPDFTARFGFSAHRVSEAQANDEILLELGHDWLSTQWYSRSRDKRSARDCASKI